MIELPGHIEPVYRVGTYLDLLYKSRLSSDHKLVGTVVARTCSYNKRDKAQLSAISNYAIGRILNLGPESVERVLADLVNYGWLYDSGRRIGARKVFVLTFSLIPLGEPKK